MVKINVLSLKATKALRAGRGIAVPNLRPRHWRWGWGSAPRPSRFTRYALYRRLGGPQGRSGRVRKISPPPGFDPRTVQPVASRYTGYAIPAASYMVRTFIIKACVTWDPLLLFIKEEVPINVPINNHSCKSKNFWLYSCEQNLRL